MPELPEVETTRCGILPYIESAKVTDIVIRQSQLRWPIPADLQKHLQGQRLQSLTRRAKYLLFAFDTGTLILHLGMSGRLCVLNDKIVPKKHDHVDICFDNGRYLRFTDPRRFGALLFTSENPNDHALIKHIGPEPLSDEFNGDYLWQTARGKKTSIKAFIMNSHIVAGVGNIYATESLFMAGIHPSKAATRVSHDNMKTLAHAIKTILKKAIKKGGTTLKDFTQSNGKPGYFRLELKVYGRGGEPCVVCHHTLKSIQITKRSTVYCRECQS